MATRRRCCERCKAEIPAERIEALPDTRVCVRCAAAMGGSEFEVRIVPVSTGKKESLKKNYTDYEVQKRRKPILPTEE
jgi:RNA polymerase-binding transcription factor DksA